MYPFSIVSVTNPCDGTPCLFICLLSATESSGFRCACPDGYELSSNGLNCSCKSTVPFVVCILSDKHTVFAKTIIVLIIPVPKQEEEEKEKKKY